MAGEQRDAGQELLDLLRRQNRIRVNGAGGVEAVTDSGEVVQLGTQGNLTQGTQVVRERRRRGREEPTPEPFSFLLYQPETAKLFVVRKSRSDRIKSSELIEVATMPYVPSLGLLTVQGDSWIATTGRPGRGGFNAVGEDLVFSTFDNVGGGGQFGLGTLAANFNGPSWIRREFIFHQAGFIEFIFVFADPIELDNQTQVFEFSGVGQIVNSPNPTTRFIYPTVQTERPTISNLVHSNNLDRAVYEAAAGQWILNRSGAEVELSDPLPVMSPGQVNWVGDVLHRTASISATGGVAIETYTFAGNTFSVRRRRGKSPKVPKEFTVLSAKYDPD
ncbi:MAG TPA: hypothetical protein V6D06_12020 [Trichocoleus sp.]